MGKKLFNIFLENRLVACFLLFFIFALDRFLKLVYLREGGEQGVIYFFGGIFGVGPFFNFKGAFSLPFSGWFFISAIIVAVLLLLYNLAVAIKKHDVEKVFLLGMILLGAVSNLYDRARYGFVIDYIHFWKISVFNIADVLIFCGAMLMIKNIFNDKNVFFKK